MENKNQIEKIKKNLENPVFTDLDNLIDKSRTKLISFSLLGFFICRYDIDMSKGLSFLGISIKNINTYDIALILVILLLYMLINFIWMSLNKLKEWNIRRTGVSKAKIKQQQQGFADKFEDMDNTNEKQASLYSFILSNEKLTCDDSRIQASLEKFNETFWQKIKSENLRWIAFDFILPIIISIASIGYLLCTFSWFKT
jgi:hypothetical protein